MHKELLQFNKKKENNYILKGTKNLKRYSSKEDTQMAIKI